MADISFLNKFKNVIRLLKEPQPIVQKPENLESDFNSFKVRSIYTSNELKTFYNNRERSIRTGASAQSHTNILLQYLDFVSSGVKGSEEKVKNLVALNPEIKKAKQIYVASVMSPNDLQEELVKISVDDPTLDEKLKEDVEEYLNDFFNKKLEFGCKLSQWLGEYSYECDAKPIMILPKSNISNLIAYQNKLSEKNNMFQEDDNFSFDSSTKKYTDKEVVERIFNEAWEVFEPSLDKTGKIEGKKKIIRQQADSVYTLIKNNANNFNFTTDIAKVVGFKMIKEKQNKDTSNKIVDNMFNTFLGQGTNILAIKDDIEDSDVQPIMLELPASAVVPIIIPGSKREHMGYFILMDEWGNPLISFNETDLTENSTGNMSRGSHNAFYSLGNPLFTNNYFNDPSQKYEINEAIFNIAMKQIFEDKFKKKDGLDLPLSEFASLSKFLFHQMLHKNKTTILFVPESLIVYYCDSYKDDGTGQSKVGSIEFVLSLRTHLLIAGVMGAIRAAIDKENFEVTIGDKNTNPEQTIEMVRNAAIDKKRLDFKNSGPVSVNRSISDASVSVTPKNFKGLDFELTRTKDSSASDYRPADDSLMEQLNKMYNNGLDVPPSSLNQLDENEFAKSVATNNIIFSNEIRKVHKRLKPLNKKLLSTYLKFSKNNQLDLLNIFRKHTGDIDDTKVIDETNDNESNAVLNAPNNVSDKDKQITNDEKKFLSSILKNIEVDLPAPNIAITKSHLEDLQAELEFIDLVLNTVYNEDTIYTQTTEYKDFLKTILANIRADKFKEILSNSTLHHAIEFPDISEFDVVGLKDKLMPIINKYYGVKNLEESIIKNLEAGVEGSEDDMSSSEEPSEEQSTDSEEPEDFNF